ncbi:MAG: hypothetical protein V8Q42_10865 [Anaerovoracaceae bacterium]
MKQGGGAAGRHKEMSVAAIGKSEGYVNKSKFAGSLQETVQRSPAGDIAGQQDFGRSAAAGIIADRRTLYKYPWGVLKPA